MAMWLCSCMAMWLHGCVAVWLDSCVAVWLDGRVAVWLFGCVAVRLCGCVAVWLFGCVAVRLCGCSAVWLCGCAVVIVDIESSPLVPRSLSVTLAWPTFTYYASSTTWYISLNSKLDQMRMQSIVPCWLPLSRLCKRILILIFHKLRHFFIPWNCFAPGNKLNYFIGAKKMLSINLPCALVLLFFLVVFCWFLQHVNKSSSREQKGMSLILQYIFIFNSVVHQTISITWFMHVY